MSAQYHYRAFGLNILSDQRISMLDRAENTPHDVRIRIGEIDDSLRPDRSGHIRSMWHADDQRVFFDITGIARFRVTQGSDICIDPVTGADDADIVAYLLGSVFAALLQQRKLLTLHASAIDGPHGAVLFLGESGAGKSTLLAAMHARGYAMLSDDISAIEFSAQSVPMVQPAFATLRLTQKAMTVFGHDPANFQSIREDKGKFLMPIAQFCEKPRPIAQAFLLNPAVQSGIDVRSLSFTEQFRLLTHFTFRKAYFRGLGLEQFHFSAMSDLAERKLLRQITRPTQGFEIQRLADCVEKVLT